MDIQNIKYKIAEVKHIHARERNEYKVWHLVNSYILELVLAEKILSINEMTPSDNYYWNSQDGMTAINLWREKAKRLIKEIEEEHEQ